MPSGTQRDVITITGSNIGNVGGEGNTVISTVNQSQPIPDFNFDKLLQELKDLKTAMKPVAKTEEEDHVVANLTGAIKASEAKNKSLVLEKLQSAGKWALEFATKTGANLVADLIRQQLPHQ